MPTRTWFPLTPRTVMVTSSPIMTVSPTRRVRMSIVRFLAVIVLARPGRAWARSVGPLCLYIEGTRKAPEREILASHQRGGLTLPAIAVAKREPKRRTHRIRGGTDDHVHITCDGHS